MLGVSFPQEPVELLTTMVDTTVISSQSDSGRKNGIGHNYLKWLLSKKVGMSTPAVVRSRNNRSSHQLVPGFSSEEMDSYQRYVSQDPVVSGHGGPNNIRGGGGARNSREGYPKRLRGSGF